MSSNLLDPTLPDEPAVAMATLVSATGSSSKKIGAKMLVGRSGRLVGGVTIGGCVDAQVIEAADVMVEKGEGGRRMLSISLDDDEAWEIGLTCGGTIEVMLDKVVPQESNDQIVNAHALVRDALSRDEAAVIVTPLDGDLSVLVVNEDGTKHGTLGTPQADAAAEAIAVGVLHTESRVEPIGGRRYFFDRFAPPMTLVIIGAGQIAMSLTVLAKELAMRTIIVDGRERYATRDRFPDASEIRVGMPSEVVSTITPHASVAAILVAHDYKYELPVLRNLLRTPIGYIGLLGSRTRGAAVREQLRGEGFSADELARIHTPIGLELGGKSSPEVALSILAEVVAVRNGKRV